MSEQKIRPEAEQSRKDVNVGALYKFLLGMGVVCALVLVGMWVEFAYLDSASKAEDPQLSPLAVKPDQPPAAPALQTNEPEDLLKVRNEEDGILHSYAWVDKNKGIVRIPVEEAMNKVAQQKDLQNVAPAPPAQTQTAPGVAQP
jgi:hypothetical protein